MICKVTKDALKQAISAITKMGNKPESVVIIAKDDMLHVVSSNDTYVWYSIPAKVEEKGTLGLQFGLFSDLSKVRKTDVTLTHHKDDNTLQVDSGSHLGVYVLPVNEEQYQKPEKDWDNTIELDSVSVGVLKNILNNTKFNYFISTGEEQANLINTKKNFIVKFADNAHSSYYTFSKPLSKTEFVFNTFIAPIRTVLSYIDTKVKMYISDSMIMFESEQLIVTISARQDKQSDYIKQSDIFMEQENYVPKKIIFDAEKFLKVLESISIVYEDGNSPVQIKIKGNKMKMKVESSMGVCEDVIKLESNDFGDLQAAFSLPIIRSTLENCLSFNSIVTMEVGNDENFYKLTCVREKNDKKDTIESLNPFVR